MVLRAILSSAQTTRRSARPLFAVVTRRREALRAAPASEAAAERLAIVKGVRSQHGMVVAVRVRAGSESGVALRPSNAREREVRIGDSGKIWVPRDPLPGHEPREPRDRGSPVFPSPLREGHTDLRFESKMPGSQLNSFRVNFIVLVNHTRRTSM